MQTGWNSLKIRMSCWSILKTVNNPKGAQMFAVRKSIQSTTPEKTGICYFSLRSIHYWRTMYENLLENLEDDNFKKKYVGKTVSSALNDSQRDFFLSEMKDLERKYNTETVYTAEEYRELEIELSQAKLSFKKQLSDVENRCETKLKNNDAYHEQDKGRQSQLHDKQTEFYKTEMKKFSKSANHNQ